MKKYLLTLLALFVILAPNVHAEENVISCSNSKNLFDGNFIRGGYHNLSENVPTFDDSDNLFATSSNFIKVNPNETYFFSMSVSAAQTYFLFFNENFEYIGYEIEARTPSNFSYKMPLKTDYLKISVRSYVLDKNFWPAYNDSTAWFQLENSDSKTDFVAFEKCNTSPDEPDQPVADATIDSFYSIYLDKLGMLANFATENKIFFSAIGILLSFVVFEVFFMLFRGRRKRR